MAAFRWLALLRGAWFVAVAHARRAADAEPAARTPRPSDAAKDGDGAAGRRAEKPSTPPAAPQPARRQAAVPRQPQGRGRRHQRQPQDRGRRDADAGDAARGRPRHLEDGLLRRRPGRGRGRDRAAASTHLRPAREAGDPARSTSPATTRSRSTKINEVLDIKKEQILDLGEAQEERREDQGPLRREGLLHGRGRPTRSSATAQSEVDVWFHVDEHAKVEVRRVNFVGNKRDHRRRAARRRSARSEGNLLSFLTSSGTYREDVFERDLLLHPGALLGPRLRAT